MEKAFKYMFKDNMLLKKSFMVVGLLLLQMICPFISGVLSKFAETAMKDNLPASFCCLIAALIISFIGFFASILFCGYFVNCIKAVSAQEENIVLPFVNFKNNLVLGFKYMVAVLLFVLEIVGLVLIPMFLLSMPATKTVGVILLVIALLLIVLIMCTCLMGFVRLFAETESMTAFARFKQILQLTEGDRKHYLTSILVSGLLGILLSVITVGIPFGIGIIAYILLTPYVTFVNAYLFAKCIDKNRFALVK